MKKCLKTIFYFLLVLLVIPAFVMAEKIESERASTSGIIKEFQMQRIRISNVGYTRYDNLGNKGPGVEIRGTVYNDFVKDIDVNIELVIYDKDENVLDVIPQTLTFKAKSTSLYRALIIEREKNYSLNSIKYYSLKGDFITNINLVVSGENDEYYLEDMNLKINVNRNNVYNVEQTFKATFNKYADAVTIGIPYRHRYINHELKYNNRAVISDIIADGYYLLKTEKGCRVVSLGQEDRNETSRNYNLKYNYNVGKDRNKGLDAFVFYLVSDNDAKIKNLTFEITMPTEVDKDAISFIDSHGNEWNYVDYEVNGNVITGSIKDVIESHTSYAIKVDLKAGYFRNASNNISSLTILSIAIPIVFMTLTIFIWFSINKINEKKEYNTFYFNKDVNSLEMSFLHNGEIKDNDIASLVFVLANKGYITIEKGKKGYKLIKEKDYDGNDKLEKSFMKELFYDKNEIERKDFKHTLTETKEVLLEKINEIKEKKKLFMNPFINYKISFWIMILVIFIVNTIDILLEYQPSVIPINIIVGGIGYMLLLGGYLSNDKPVEKLLYVLVSLIFIIVPIVLTSYMAFVEDSLKLSAYIVGLLCMIVIALIMNAMGNRTVYGNMMYNKINAYKQFLTTVDIKTVITEVRYNNRNLLYDVLPYAIVLGISDKWVDKFAGSNASKPKWYKCNTFKLDTFYQDVKDVYSDIYIALKSK